MLDVLAVNMETHAVKVLASNLTERNADAVERLAVMRRGVETDFYTTAPAGRYKDGDEWSDEDK